MAQFITDEELGIIKELVRDAVGTQDATSLLGILVKIEEWMKELSKHVACYPLRAQSFSFNVEVANQTVIAECTFAFPATSWWVYVRNRHGYYCAVSEVTTADMLRQLKSLR